MANVGSKGILQHIDDPSVTVVAAAAAAGVTWVSDADTSDTDFVRAVAAGKGLHYSGALAATNNNMIEFCGNNLQFTGQEGHSAIEIMVQFDTVATLAFSFGFNDEVEDSGGTLPMELGTTTISATATTFVGLLFDTGATHDELHCVWVDDGSVGQTDSTGKVDGEYIRMKGMAPTAGKWLYMKVEMQDRGSGNGVRATFLAVDHNGRSIEKVFNTSVDRDCPLCFHFAAENRAALIHTIYVKSPNWEQTIADM